MPDEMEFLRYQWQRDRLKEFAEWIVSMDDDDPNSPGRKDRQTVTLTQIINRAKEALDG